MIAESETFGGTWPYKANYCTTAGFRQHYVDEGSKNGEVKYVFTANPHGATYIDGLLSLYQQLIEL